MSSAPGCWHSFLCELWRASAARELTYACQPDRADHGGRPTASGSRLCADTVSTALAREPGRVGCVWLIVYARATCAATATLPFLSGRITWLRARATGSCHAWWWGRAVGEATHETQRRKGRALLPGRAAVRSCRAGWGWLSADERACFQGWGHNAPGQRNKHGARSRGARLAEVRQAHRRSTLLIARPSMRG